MELVVTVRRSAGFAFDMDAGHAAAYSIAGHIRSCGDIALDIVAGHGAARLDVALDAVAGDRAAGTYAALTSSQVTLPPVLTSPPTASQVMVPPALYCPRRRRQRAHRTRCECSSRGPRSRIYPAVLGSVAAADKRMPVIEHSVQAVIIRPRQLVVFLLCVGSPRRAASLPKSSSIVTPNTSASIGKLDTSGLDSPFSHLLTA